MLKKLCKNISVILIGVILISVAFKFGQCSRRKPSHTTETIFKTDTLDYEYPDYVKKPGLIFRFTHKSIQPRSIQPIKFKPWMDSVYCAYSVKIKSGKMEIKGKRGQVSHEFNYDDVPPNVEIYGTEIGFNIIKHRFKNPFGWNGVLIGTRVYYDKTVLPYIQTGIRIKCIGINVGIDKESIYADVSYRVW